MLLTADSLATFRRRYTDLYTAAITTGPNQAAAVTQLQGLLDAWNKEVQDSITASQTNITNVSEKAATLAESQQTLKELLAKQGTRDQQASSVNPKITQSPYVNILGLRRNFRHNTRVGLIIASAVFGILALGALGYYITTSVSEKTVMNPSALIQGQSGGRRR